MIPRYLRLIQRHKPLFNEEPVSFDTLDVIFRIEGRPTNVHDLRYFSKSFDKFSYIYKKASRIYMIKQSVISSFYQNPNVIKAMH